MSENEDARFRLLAAAGPVFAEKGYEQTTVREICQAAEVNLAAINYYFGDKQTLYIESVRQAHAALVERVPMPEWPSNTLPATKLRGFVKTLLTRMLNQDTSAWQPRLMLREILHPTEAVRALVEDYFRPHLHFLESILIEMLGSSVPTFQIRQIAFSIVGQCLFYRVSGEIVQMIVPDENRAKFFRTEQLSEHITNFSLAALGQTPPLIEGALAVETAPEFDHEHVEHEELAS